MASAYQCSYQALCKEYFKDYLQLPDYYFNQDQQACCCADCHHRSGEPDSTQCGDPPKPHPAPIGWCRFGIKLHHRAQLIGALQKWHRAYHGTKAEYLIPILKIDDICPPGCTVVGGNVIGEQEGHFNDDWKPAEFNTKRVFLSPSIKYAGVDAYAAPKRWMPHINDQYEAQVALEVLVEPGSYTAEPQTIGAYYRLDPLFSNEELEWCINSDQRGRLIIMGVLVKLEKPSESRPVIWSQAELSSEMRSDLLSGAMRALHEVREPRTLAAIAERLHSIVNTTQTARDNKHRWQCVVSMAGGGLGTSVWGRNEVVLHLGDYYIDMFHDSPFKSCGVSRGVMETQVRRAVRQVPAQITSVDDIAEHIRETVEGKYGQGFNCVVSPKEFAWKGYANPDETFKFELGDKKYLVFRHS